MTPTLAAILAVIFLLGYWLWRRQRARVSAIDPTSAEWQAAVRRALAATIVTPMLERPAGAAPASLFQLAELEDWHVLLPDGRIRGSFTTRAQIQICRTTGQRIPRELQGIEGLLVDT